MSDLERIVVLAGGLSPEREVSLRSGDRVRDALAEAGIHAIVADECRGQAHNCKRQQPPKSGDIDEQCRRNPIKSADKKAEAEGVT